jgi:cytochrome bd-type quinol oxidase subunit 1
VPTLCLSTVTLLASGLLGRLFSSYALMAMLIIGFAFAIIQGARKKLTYRMRMVSSSISLVLAIYLIVVGSMYILSGTMLIPLGLLSLLLAYRLVRTDVKTWQWFREQAGTSDS